MTLQEAFDKHPDDVRWLRDMAQVDLAEWDTSVEVTHFTDGVNDVYLGEEDPTVFVVHGQTEPQLVHDGGLWAVYRYDETWQAADETKRWRVQFDLVVSGGWIEDGFDLTPALVKEVVQEGILQYARDFEKEVKNITVVVRRGPK
jgi:hypothetical protein